MATYYSHSSWSLPAAVALWGIGTSTEECADRRSDRRKSEPLLRTIRIRAELPELTFFLYTFLSFDNPIDRNGIYVMQREANDAAPQRRTMEGNKPKPKLKPVRRDPEKRRQQNILAQRKYSRCRLQVRRVLLQRNVNRVSL